jgi:hypothetical protein
MEAMMPTPVSSVRPSISWHGLTGTAFGTAA